MDNIRQTQKQDYTSIISLMNEFYNSEAVLHSVDTKNFDITFNLCINDNPFACCYVYEEDKIIKGYVLLSFTHSNEVGGTVVWIEEVYVSPEYRGCGIGKKLLKFVHDKYSDIAKRFRLEATSENKRAIALYKSMEYDTLDYLQMTRDL